MDTRLYESVKYQFTNDEMRELGGALAREAQIVFDLREQKKNATASLTASITAANKRVGDLTTKINNGYEMREVEVIAEMDKPRPGIKTIWRVDTGEELRKEPMTMQEMQQSFGFPEPDVKPEEGSSQ